MRISQWQVTEQVPENGLPSPCSVWFHRESADTTLRSGPLAEADYQVINQSLCKDTAYTP